MTLLESPSISGSKRTEVVEAFDTCAFLEDRFGALAALLKGRIILPGVPTMTFRQLSPGNYDRRPGRRARGECIRHCGCRPARVTTGSKSPSAAAATVSVASAPPTAGW